MALEKLKVGIKDFFVICGRASGKTNAMIRLRVTHKDSTDSCRVVFQGGCEEEERGGSEKAGRPKTCSEASTLCTVFICECQAKAEGRHGCAQGGIAAHCNSTFAIAAAVAAARAAPGMSGKMVNIRLCLVDLGSATNNLN